MHRCPIVAIPKLEPNGDALVCGALLQPFAHHIQLAAQHLLGMTNVVVALDWRG
jgi:hypothetical protein